MGESSTRAAVLVLEAESLPREGLEMTILRSMLWCSDFRRANLGVWVVMESGAIPQRLAPVQALISTFLRRRN
jgi:hypothetical protein